LSSHRAAAKIVDETAAVGGQLLHQPKIVRVARPDGFLRGQ
jgi:hypothetical protein